MEQHTGTDGWWRACCYAVSLSLILAPGLSWSLELSKAPPAERRESISLADAALQALKHNLDISISRQTKESRQADITVEQAKFDPTLSVNGQYNRTVNPLNRPVFGGTPGALGEITTLTPPVNTLAINMGMRSVSARKPAVIIISAAFDVE